MILCILVSVYQAAGTCGDGRQAGVNAWRNVEGVMMVSKVFNKCKGKVVNSCVMPASAHGLKTVTLTELEQCRLHVCENNWIRRKENYEKKENKISKRINCNRGLPRWQNSKEPVEMNWTRGPNER